MSTSQGQPDLPVRVKLAYDPAFLPTGDRPLLIHGIGVNAGWLPEATEHPGAGSAVATVDSFSPMDWVNEATYVGGLITGDRADPPTDCRFGDFPDWLQDVNLPHGDSNQVLHVCLGQGTNDDQAVLVVVNNRGYAQTLEVTGARFDLARSAWGESLQAQIALAFAKVATDGGTQRFVLAPGKGARLVFPRPRTEQGARVVRLRSASLAATGYLGVAWSILAAAKKEIGELGLPVSAVDCLIGQAYNSFASDAGASEAMSQLRSCADIATGFASKAAQQTFRKITLGLAVNSFFYKYFDSQADAIYPPAMEFTIRAVKGGSTGSEPKWDFALRGQVDVFDSWAPDANSRMFAEVVAPPGLTAGSWVFDSTIGNYSALSHDLRGPSLSADGMYVGGTASYDHTYNGAALCGEFRGSSAEGSLTLVSPLGMTSGSNGACHPPRSTAGGAVHVYPLTSFTEATAGRDGLYVTDLADGATWRAEDRLPLAEGEKALDVSMPTDRDIALVTAGKGGPPISLWMLDLKSDQAVSIAVPEGYALHATYSTPQWTADGTGAAIRLEGPAGGDLFMFEVADRVFHQLTGPEVIDLAAPVAFSSNETEVAVWETTPSGYARLLRLKRDGSGTRPVAPELSNHGLQLRALPGGGFVTMTFGNVWAVDGTSNDWRPLLPLAGPIGHHPGLPLATANGRIFFGGWNGGDVGSKVNASAWSIRPDGSDLQQIVPDAAAHWEMRALYPSSDGTHVLGVMVVDDGTQPRYNWQLFSATFK